MEPQAKSNTTLIISIIVTVVVVAAVVIYFFAQQEKPLPPSSREVVGPPAGEAITSPDLGGEVFDEASNPIQGELPKTVAPVPNPLEGLYKNPFQ